MLILHHLLLNLCQFLQITLFCHMFCLLDVCVVGEKQITAAMDRRDVEGVGHVRRGTEEEMGDYI